MIDANKIRTYIEKNYIQNFISDFQDQNVKIYQTIKRIDYENSSFVHFSNNSPNLNYYGDEDYHIEKTVSVINKSIIKFIKREEKSGSLEVLRKLEIKEATHLFDLLCYYKDHPMDKDEIITDDNSKDFLEFINIGISSLEDIDEFIHFYETKSLRGVNGLVYESHFINYCAKMIDNINKHINDKDVMKKMTFVEINEYKQKYNSRELVFDETSNLEKLESNFAMKMMRQLVKDATKTYTHVEEAEAITKNVSRKIFKTKRYDYFTQIYHNLLSFKKIKDEYIDGDDAEKLDFLKSDTIKETKQKFEYLVEIVDNNQKKPIIFKSFTDQIHSGIMSELIKKEGFFEFVGFCEISSLLNVPFSDKVKELIESIVSKEMDVEQIFSIDWSLDNLGIIRDVKKSVKREYKKIEIQKIKEAGSRNLDIFNVYETESKTIGLNFTMVEKFIEEEQYDYGFLRKKMIELSSSEVFFILHKEKESKDDILTVTLNGDNVNSLSVEEIAETIFKSLKDVYARKIKHMGECPHVKALLLNAKLNKQDEENVNKTNVKRRKI